MKTTVNYSLVLFAAVLGCFSAACSSDDDKKTPGGGGGDNIVLTPSETGWVDKGSNPLGIQGAWYAYADSLGDDGQPPGKCQKVGMHSDAECSKVETPQPGSFAPSANGMCTKGTVAKVINGSNGMPDYSNIWGAGIALDFGAPSEGEAPGKKVADLSAYSGFSFELSAKPAPGLRVEMPMPSTENTTDGSDYWGGSSAWGNSPVVVGLNTFKWADITPPGASTAMYDPKQALGIQFHVPTGTAAAGAYEFCINKLTLVK